MLNKFSWAQVISDIPEVASMEIIDGHTLNWDVMSIVFPQEFPLSLVYEYKNQLNLNLVLD